MQCIEKARCANGMFAFVVTGEKPGLIGEHYFPINSMKAQTVDKCYCETDMHYYERKSKEPIPVDTIVDINCYWRNFYGDYFRVSYNGKMYDVDPKYLKIINNDSTRD